MPKKAALYIRVSTVYQIDKDSLPMQRKDLISYAHFVLGIDDYEIFEDAGYSGKNVERPAYKDMMRRCRDGEFSHILVWKIDRISRNLLDFAAMYAEIKKLGVVFVSKNEQFDTSSAIGEAMLKIILVFAELERNMTSERVTAAMASRAKQGHWNGSVVPYGYKWDKINKVPVINEEESIVLKNIFQIYAKEKSLGKVVMWLDQQKIPSKRGGRWDVSTIRNFIVNPFYIGTLRWGYRNFTLGKKRPKEEWIVTENAHPAIIDRQLWDKCNQQLLMNCSFLDKKGKQKRVVHTHIFSNLLICGVCGKYFHAQVGLIRKNKNIRPSQYLCSDSRNSVPNPCKNKGYLSDLKLGSFLFNYISNIINARKTPKAFRSPKDLEHYLLNGQDFIDVVGIAEIDSIYSFLKGVPYSTSYSQELPKESEDAITKLKQEKAKKERALERLNNLFLYDDEAMSEAQYIITKNKLKDDIYKLTEQISAAATPQTMSEDIFVQCASNLIMFKTLESESYIDIVDFYDVMETEQVKEFVRSIISSIVIKDKHIMSISFKNGDTHHFAYK